MAEERPFLQVVRGDATPEEIAALVAVLAARAAAAAPTGPPARRPSEWARRARLVRRPVAPGPGAWRASGLPG
ncbi:acyl-CoA carboxylase subunit epsilon [Actinomadura scrupuli]|uniref:acyl-CoA carboxylase subunit epsilon n=1 Tax=Actinomadura scrupuli TaxID=559629 RepID=UPI003D967F35